MKEKIKVISFSSNTVNFVCLYWFWKEAIIMYSLNENFLCQSPVVFIDENLKFLSVLNLTITPCGNNLYFGLMSIKCQKLYLYTLIQSILSLTRDKRQQMTHR